MTTAPTPTTATSRAIRNPTTRWLLSLSRELEETESDDTTRRYLRSRLALAYGLEHVLELPRLDSPLLASSIRSCRYRITRQNTAAIGQRVALAKPEPLRLIRSRTERAAPNVALDVLAGRTDRSLGSSADHRFELGPGARRVLAACRPAVVISRGQLPGLAVVPGSADTGVAADVGADWRPRSDDDRLGSAYR
jgi:hypothetical protein